MKITIGILTYKREEKLERLLLSLNDQEYNNFKVIVSNDFPLSELKSIDESKYKFEVEYILQKKNLGLVENYLFLLNRCDTEYFMWLADDDEISINYLSSNLHYLEFNSDYVCSVGTWIRKDEKGSLSEISIKSIYNKSKINRYYDFVVQNSDHFIYGLFRTDELKKCIYRKYYQPNSLAVENWCFPYLIQLLNKHFFHVNDDAKYIDNYQSTKFYMKTDSTFTGKIKYKLRRMNVYFYYFLGFIDL